MASRKQRPSHKPAGTFSVIASLLRSRFSASITTGVFLLLIVTAATLICYELRYIAMHTTTVAGDNLKPTPWHMFSMPQKNTRSGADRLLTIVKCNYLSCLTHTLKPLQHHVIQSNHTHSCPSFFQWIYEDLAPWRRSKISIDSLEAAQKLAAFRVVIVGGRLYMKFYYACVLPRAMFTLWGLLQLLDKYPGMVPDVDLMFDCMDRPVVKKPDYKDTGPPPPLFRYCGHKEAFDIPFPDWSFWGWPQIDMLPWAEEVESIYKASKNIRWEDRRPTAYWKGNPDVGSKVREDLLKCNTSKKNDWGAEIFRQDWWAEVMAGYSNSKLSEQCKHRFKIYAEGHAWSVSFKYIFACDSPVLVASPMYHEFFTRALIPMVHYWPIRQDGLCPSIKFAVDWGNKHATEAKAIGKAGQDFVWRNLSMDQVYDYMFHLLSEYSKLQNFKPVVPSNAQVLCEIIDVALGINMKEMVQKVPELFQVPLIGDFIPSLGFLDRRIKRSLDTLHKQFDVLLEGLLREREDRLRGRSAEGAPAIILDVLLDNLDKGKAKTIMMELIVAAIDTSATTLDWVMAELLESPHAMSKLQEEIGNVVQQERMVEEADLPSLVYMKAVVKEALRMHAPVALLVPHMSTDVCKVGGYTLPKGTRLFVNAWAIGRDPKTWEDPERFMPERFLTKEGIHMDLRGQDFGLLPFGSGRRSCPGLPLALPLIESTLSNLVHAFDWRSPPGHKVDFSERFSTVVSRAKPLLAIPYCR